MKKEYFTPIAFALLSIVFITISFLLYFDKNNKWLVARKIKIGAIMLTLSIAFSSCSKNRPAVTCYDPIPEDTTQNADTSSTRFDNIDSDIEKINNETLIPE